MTDEPPGVSTAGQSTAQPPCTATAKHGGSCRSWALPGSAFCQTHDPNRQERVHEQRSRGGKIRALRARRRRLQTAAALVRYGGDLLLDMQEATITLDLGRGLFYALSVQCRLVELMQTRDIERRLAAIEERLANTGQSRSMPWSA